jgi:hypothetical protein
VAKLPAIARHLAVASAALPLIAGIGIAAAPTASASAKTDFGVSIYLKFSPHRYLGSGTLINASTVMTAANILAGVPVSDILIVASGGSWVPKQLSHNVTQGLVLLFKNKK